MNLHTASTHEHLLTQLFFFTWTLETKSFGLAFGTHDKLELKHSSQSHFGTAILWQPDFWFWVRSRIKLWNSFLQGYDNGTCELRKLLYEGVAATLLLSASESCADEVLIM